MLGQGRPTISALVAAICWLAGALSLAAQEPTAPVDSLRIIANHDPLIFAPGEQFTFDLEPLLAGVEPSTTIDIATTLTPARGTTTLWSAQQRLPVPVDGPAIATLHVPMPRQEGVYEIRLAVTRPPGFRERFFPGGGAPLVVRSFQVVVLDRIPAAPATEAEWRTLLEIDPANPAWSARLPDWTQIRRLPGVSRRPIGSVRTTAVTLPLGVFVELPPTPPQGEPHWQAYPLAIEAVGVPHLLEIEYPNDREQHLGISIVEPDATGQFVTIGRDSGVYVEGLGSSERVEKQKHRLVFWPRTNSPLVLITNQHPTASARFGHIRVMKRTASTIATEPWASAPTGRLAVAYLARPVRGELPATTANVDPAASHHADDWQTLYDGALQLAEYLNYAGYNAAAINVLADGGALLPSNLLHTERHADIGPIGVDADLPLADGLELMLRIFDRSGLALMPSLEFTAPLPELESLRQRADAKTGGIELVGPGGLTWLEAHSSDRGLTPHYNLLDDRVQQAMLDVAREVVQRYGRHPSFDSLAVQLSGRGYGVLPDLGWGLDDTTVARFEQETGIRIAADGPDRFTVRHELLTGEHADAWRAWRAARVTRFYQQLAELVASSGGKRRLLLTTENLLSNTEAAAKVRPNVVAKTRLERTMLDMGIDWQALNSTPGVVVLPTRYVESMVPLVDRAVDLSINDAFAGAERTSAAALFYHRPQRHDFASFNALSPFAAHAQLLTQSAAHGAAMRQPYVAALVESDPSIVIDGGETVPLGQEDFVRHVRSVLKALPTNAATSVRREHDVTVRTYDDRGQTVCLVVNECPWHADVTLDVVADAPTDARPLVDSKDGPHQPAMEHFAAGRQLWSLQLAPYDVHAVRFAAAGVEIENIQSQISEAGRQELAARMAELKDRDLTATPHYAALRNPGFEPGGGTEHLPGWQLVGEPSLVAADLDATLPKEGRSCLYLQNRGNGKATIESESFATPPTGQLVMWVFARGENVAPSTELRLVFEVDGAAQPYRKFTVLGGNRPGANPLTNAWGSGYAFSSEDLPLDSRGRMRIKFELSGPGEVWIDNVQLYDLLFPLYFYERSEPEKLELVKLITAVDSALENGELAECVRKLEGYWPRFLNAYTPAAAPAIATRPPRQEIAVPAAEVEQTPAEPRVGSRWFEFWKH
ncbi:MAG: hypothetical protein WD971_14265 [Pirellulales bacterium]